MTYYLIGSGNMAWFLASRMQAGGHTCVGVWGRNFNAVAALAQEYRLPILQSFAEVHDGPDACLLAVSDNAIQEIAAQVSFNSTVLIHHSGGAAAGILGNSTLQGIVWPVYSILKKEIPVHRNFPCVWEANNANARRVVQEICNSISSIQYEAALGQRPWLHLTAVMGNNFTNYLLGMCADICAQQNLPFNLLQPILQQTLDRVNTANPRDVQTGPARRGDDQTIASQIELLRENPYWQTVYFALSDAIKNTYSASPSKD